MKYWKFSIGDLLYVVFNVIFVTVNGTFAFLTFSKYASFDAILLWDTQLSRTMLFVNSVWAGISFFWLLYKRMMLNEKLELIEKSWKTDFNKFNQVFPKKINGN